VSFGGESVLYPGGALQRGRILLHEKKPHATILRPVRPLVSTASERVVGRTSCTHSRKQSWRSASNEVLVRLSLATSVAFEGTTRAANLGIGATTAISTCTGGRSTASRRYSTTRRKSKASTWSWCRNAIRRSRVRRAATQTRISVLNVGCTCARSAVRFANADVNGAENIRQKVLPSLATDGGDRDNGWLAQPGFTCSTVVRVFSPTRTGREPRTVISQLSGAVPWDSRVFRRGRTSSNA